MTTTGKNGIMIYGPKTDGTYLVEFRTAEGESLAISIPRTETAVSIFRSACRMDSSCQMFCEEPLARPLSFFTCRIPVQPDTSQPTPVAFYPWE